MMYQVQYVNEQGVIAVAEVVGFTGDLGNQVGGTAGAFTPINGARCAQHGLTVEDGPLMVGIALTGEIQLMKVTSDGGSIDLTTVGVGTTKIIEPIDPEKGGGLFGDGFDRHADVLGVDGGAVVVTGKVADPFGFYPAGVPTVENRLTFFAGGEIEIPDTKLLLGGSNQRASFAGQ